MPGFSPEENEAATGWPSDAEVANPQPEIAMYNNEVPRTEEDSLYQSGEPVDADDTGSRVIDEIHRRQENARI